MSPPVHVAAVSAFWPGGRGADALLDVPGLASRRTFPDDELTAALTMRGLRPLSRTARLAMVVASDVWPSGGQGNPRDAVVLASAWASSGPLADFVQVAAAEGPDMVFPMAFPNTVASVHAGYVASLLGIRGPNVSTCGPSAGLDAVLQGLRLVAAGRADRVLVLGAEAADPAVAVARPDATEAAGAVLLTRTADETTLATIESWKATRSPDALRRPARHGRSSSAAVAPGPCGAASGVLDVVAAVVKASRGREQVVEGRSGVRGFAVLRLVPTDRSSYPGAEAIALSASPVSR